MVYLFLVYSDIIALDLKTDTYTLKRRRHHAEFLYADIFQKKIGSCNGGHADKTTHFYHVGKKRMGSPSELADASYTQKI